MRYALTLPLLLCLLVLPAAAQSATAFDPAVALRVSQAVVGKTVADHTLLDRAGRPVKLSGYRGNPLLVSFI